MTDIQRYRENTASLTNNWTGVDNVTQYDYYDGLIVTYFIGDVTIYLDLYFVPVVIALGLVGNTCSFLVFMTTHLRSLSSSVYLSALAVSDNGFLLCVLVSWINNVNVHLYHRNVWCQTFVYLTYVFSFLSVWYVVGFTVERYIAVCFPFRRCAMCTTRRAKIVVVAMSVFAAITYIFALWTSSVEEVAVGPPFCVLRQKHQALMTVISYIDTTITLLVPSLSLVFLNVRIVWAVGMVGVLKRQSMESRDGTSPEAYSMSRVTHVDQRSRSSPLVNQRSRTTPHVNQRSRTTPQIRITRMLVVVSTVFLALNLPSHACRVYLFIMRLAKTSDYMPGELFFHWQRLFLYVYYINFAINIFLYSICGRNFRLALKGLFWRCRRGRGRNSHSTWMDPDLGTPALTSRTHDVVLRCNLLGRDQSPQTGRRVVARLDDHASHMEDSV